MTHVLMISTDAKILTEGSDVRARMIEYGKLFDELHIIVFTLKARANVPNAALSQNIFVYPTQSLTKLFYIKDATKIGESIIARAKLGAGHAVITTQDPFETGTVGKKLSERFDIPLHVQIHTDFYSPYFKESILNRIRIALSKKVLPHAVAIRVVSERIKQSLPEDLQSKTSVLPIFADIESIQGAPILQNLRKKYPKFQKIVLMASRLTKEKDIGSAIEACASTLKDFPHTGLVIVGEGTEEKNLQLKVESLKIGENVVFEPWADHETLVSYMKTCDIFLSASLYEGYGLSMLEAYISGATLVATDAGIAPLLASPECLVKPGDVQGITQALLKALEGSVSNKPYEYPYKDKRVYFEAYKNDILRAKNALV